MNKQYKLIAVDMDGTLLNDEKEITPKTLEALQLVREKGMLLTICTGRNITGIEKFMKLLKPDGPVICNNGAIIMSPDGRETLFNCTMDRSDARRVYNQGIKLGATLLIWCQNVFYTNELNERSYGYKKYSGMEPVLLEDFDRLNEKGITKILYCNDPVIVDGYLKNIEELTEGDFPGNTTFCKSLPFFLEFFNNRVSKGKALEFVAGHCGIPMEEVIAFGDGMNDYPMIEKAGLGVAMGNACEALKRAADATTEDNNHDGIAGFLMKYICDIPDK